MARSTTLAWASAGALALLCLYLFARMREAEAERPYKISPHTVDQRIRNALQTLGVERRAQAARIVAGSQEPYQRLIHQSPYVVANGTIRHPDEAISNQIRHADRAGEAGGAGFNTEQRPTSSWSSLPLPFATRSNPRNEMSVGMRLLWIVVIATGAAFSAGMYLAGLESLARLLGS